METIKYFLLTHIGRFLLGAIGSLLFFSLDKVFENDILSLIGFGFIIVWVLECAIMFIFGAYNFLKDLFL